MSDIFTSPEMSFSEFKVSPSVGGSGTTGGAHDAGNGGAPCSLTASNGVKACGPPSTKNSAQHEACS